MHKKVQAKHKIGCEFNMDASRNFFRSYFSFSQLPSPFTTGGRLNKYLSQLTLHYKWQHLQLIQSSTLSVELWDLVNVNRSQSGDIERLSLEFISKPCDPIFNQRDTMCESDSISRSHNITKGNVIDISLKLKLHMKFNVKLSKISAKNILVSFHFYFHDAENTPSWEAANVTEEQKSVNLPPQ